MASINFIQPIFTDNVKAFLYSDLHLDMQEQKIYNKGGGITNSSTSDIQVDYDINAIKNSINNLFNTKKGQRPLYPDYGLNLEQYLFEPINDNTAYNIGREIKAGISLEPRVILATINIYVLPTEDGYGIDMALYIPTLSINTNVYATLTSKEGFILK